MGSSRHGRHPSAQLRNEKYGDASERGFARSLADALCDILRAEHDSARGNIDCFENAHLVRERDPSGVPYAPRGSRPT